MPIITEVIDTRDVYLVSEYADVLQIGARNMQNFSLLVEVGKTKKPVLLKRGLYATIEEWLNCAEYILKEGNPNVILCERGIRCLLYTSGESADWDALIPICKKYGVPILEDAAEAIGATYKGKKCGSFGDISIFSFNGNKLITTRCV